MVHQRIYGILAGYENCNDHDTLRGDPVVKMVKGCTFAAAVFVNRKSTVRVRAVAVRESACQGRRVALQGSPVQSR